MLMTIGNMCVGGVHYQSTSSLFLATGITSSSIRRPDRENVSYSIAICRSKDLVGYSYPLAFHNKGYNQGQNWSMDLEWFCLLCRGFPLGHTLSLCDSATTAFLKSFNRRWVFMCCRERIWKKRNECGFFFVSCSFKNNRKLQWHDREGLETSKDSQSLVDMPKSTCVFWERSDASVSSS